MFKTRQKRALFRVNGIIACGFGLFQADESGDFVYK